MVANSRVFGGRTIRIEDTRPEYRIHDISESFPLIEQLRSGI